MIAPRRTLAAAALALALAAGTGCGTDSSPTAPQLVAVDPATPANHEFVIPSGTGQRLDAGEAVEVLPARLDARVGEVLRIENADERGHLVGAFYVKAGETLVQRFVGPGQFSGECSVHPSGRFELEVAP